MWRALPLAALALPLAVLVLALTAAGVLAHANAVRTAPAAGAVLAAPPVEIAVWFDSAIDPAASGITVLDRSGRAVAQGRGAPDGSRERVALAAPVLEPGNYTAAWQNVSTDGHPNGGYFSFSVGRPDPPLAVAPASDMRTSSSGPVTLAVAPEDDGGQRLTVTPLDARGAPLSNVQRVFLRFRLQQPAAGPASVDADPASNGRYVARTSLLAVVGTYEVEVVVRRRRADDVTTRFSLQASQPASPPAATGTPATAAPPATVSTPVTPNPPPAAPDPTDPPDPSP